MTASLRLVPYDETYLDRSWTWLRDAEIKTLTMTPDFNRQDQRQFFDSLPHRTDYRIWGVERTGHGPIGAAGLKNIADKRAEYWGYIGERSQWGLGLGTQMISAVEKEAAAIGINYLYLTVAKNNERAVSLYRKVGYAVEADGQDTLTMVKPFGLSSPK